MSFLQQIRSIFWPDFDTGPRFRVSHVSEPKDPKTIQSNTVYVASSQGHAKWVQILCPCGCGEVILLNLSKKRRPNWAVRKTFWGKPTISPSIWRKDGCGSHFFIREGRVAWCPKVPEHRKREA